MSLDFDSARLSNPYLTAEHEEWRTQVRRFIDREIMPYDNVNYLSHIILKGVAQFVKTVIIKPMLQTIEDHPNGRYDKVNEQSDSN